MSKDCNNDNIGWGTILSLTINGVLSIVATGFAWKSYRSKASARHEVEAHNKVTFPDGRVEERGVRASIVAEKQTEQMSFELKGKAVTNGTGTAAVTLSAHQDEKDLEIGPKGAHLQARSIQMALNSAMSAVDDPSEVVRKDALVRLAVVTQNPTHAATASIIQAAAKVVSGRSSRVGSDAEFLDDGSGVALVSAHARDGSHKGSKMSEVTLLAMGQQRGLIVQRGNSGGDAAEHAAVSAGDSGDTVIHVLGDAALTDSDAK